MRKISLAIFLLCATSFASMAQVRLASIFTDNMVIEQSTHVTLWGTAPSRSKVRVIASWAPNDTIVVTANPSCRWSAVLLTPKADMKAHTIKCNEAVIENVMLGEVWLCSGQSNMQWNVGNGILNGKAEAQAANHPNIRIFTVPLLGADTPQLCTRGQWKVCDPASMSEGSAIGYFFARALNRALNVPVGIISSAWGGSNIESWIPADTMAKDKNLMDSRMKGLSPWHPNEPSKIYNQMINPLIPFAIAGTIWYQGESNRANAGAYDAMMGALIESWRTKFNRQFPFYFVQIAPFNYGHNDLLAAIVREQQEMSAARIANTGMVVVMDRVDDVNNIHPLDKVTVGERLAAYALAETYGHQIQGYKSPTFKSVTFDKGKAIVSLVDAQVGLKINGQKVVGMKIAGADSKFVDAQARILKDNRIEVYAKSVPQPQAVRYCFDDASIGNISTATGLPVAPFRSDK